MIEEWKTDYRKLPRTSKKSPEYLEKKKAIVLEYINSWGEKKVSDLAKEYGVNKSQVTRTLQKEISNIGNAKNDISDTVLENVSKGSRLAKEFIESLKKEDLKNMDDFAKFTNALKSQYWLHNAIENYGNSNSQKNIIPVNVNIQYNNITNNNKDG